MRPEYEYCPCCGYKKYLFSEGERASSIWDRFDKTSPNIGYCWACEYYYSEHVDHPEKEQIEKHKQSKKWQEFLKKHPKWKEK